MTRSTVFGIDVWSDRPLMLLAGTEAPATGRSLDVLLDADGESKLDWPPAARRIADERTPDGRMLYAIEWEAEAGHLLFGPRFGGHLISPDLRRLRCAPAGAPAEVWQRFLVAQVLPFAAALRGLQVLHASGVVIAGRAVALLGPSGAGKTSLALALCRHGARFLADDVLALELEGDALIAHPGSPLAGVERSEARRADVGRRACVLAANERELLLRVAPAAAPALVTDVFLLQRDADGPAIPSFEAVGDAAPLLASSFNLLLRDGARMRRLLDVCAAAARRRVERVRVDAHVDSDTVAQALIERLGRHS